MVEKFVYKHEQTVPFCFVLTLRGRKRERGRDKGRRGRKREKGEKWMRLKGGMRKGREKERKEWQEERVGNERRGGRKRIED